MFSLEAAADAVAELISEQQLQGCCVVGYSLGARLALLLAHRHAALLSGAVIISGSPGQQLLHTPIPITTRTHPNPFPLVLNLSLAGSL